MNSQKIGFQEHVEQNLGFSRDCNFEYVHNQAAGFQQQPWNMEQNPGAAKLSSSSTNTIMSGFQTPASAFYATERFLGFPQELQFDKSCNSQFPNSFHGSGESFSIDSITQDDQPNYELGNTLQSLVKSQIGSNIQYQNSLEKSYKIPCTDHQTNLLGNNAAVAVGNHFSVPFRGNQDQRVSFVIIFFQFCITEVVGS